MPSASKVYSHTPGVYGSTPSGIGGFSRPLTDNIPFIMHSPLALAKGKQIYFLTGG